MDLITSNEKNKGHINTVSGDQLNHVRSGTTRTLNSLFGSVIVTRKGYIQVNQSSLYPVDAELNLSDNSYSDGLRDRVANESIRGSFDDVVEVIGETTGGHVPKRQCLNIVREVAQDFEAFYQKKRFIKPEETSDLLVLTFDGKGIVMRPDGLRECTKKAALKSKKLKSRLSQGEKRQKTYGTSGCCLYCTAPYSYGRVDYEAPRRR